MIYAALPMAIFHERQVLTEPAMAAFTTLAFLFAALNARQARPGFGLGAGAALGAAVMTKMFALPFLAIPLWAALILGRGGDRSTRLRSLLYAGAGTGLAGLLIGVSYRVGAAFGVTTLSSFKPSVENTVIDRLLAPETLILWRADLSTLADIGLTYFGPVILILLALGVVPLIRREGWQAITFLAVPALAYLTVPMLVERTTGSVYPPRYLLSSAAPLAVLAAISAGWLIERVPGGRIRSWAGTVVVLLTLIPSLIFAAGWLENPRKELLAAVDGEGMYQATFSGDFRELGAAMLKESRAAPPGVIVHLAGMNIEMEMMSAFIGPRAADLGYFQQDVTEEEMIGWLAGGEPVYFVAFTAIGDQASRDRPGSARLDPLLTAPALTGEATLYQIRGFDGPIADLAGMSVSPPPDRVRDDFNALVGEDPADLTLIYPADFGGALPLQAVPVHIFGWPLTWEIALEGLAALPPPPPFQTLDLLRVNPDQSDPERALESLISARFYRLEERWSGPVQQIRYLNGAENPALPALDVTFESVIHLRSGGPLEESVRPGEAIRFVFIWESDIPVADSFKVFVHLVDGDGKLIAQADSVPGDGLSPMTGWEPGEAVAYRFALRLPDDAPPGILTVRVGVYHPDSGLRLPVTAAAEHGGDFAVIGRVRVEETGG